MTVLYCTVQDVRNALTPGGSKEDTETFDKTGNTAATLEDWQIEDAIIEAQTIVNLCVLQRYQIINEDVSEPVDPNEDPPTMHDVSVAPQPIRHWTRSLAAWYATLTNRQGKDLEERDPVELRRLQVLNNLNAVAAGSLILQLPLSENTADDGGVTVVNIYEGDLFTLDDFGLVMDPGSKQVYVSRYYPWL